MHHIQTAVLVLFANEIPGHTEYDLQWRCILIAHGIILGLFGVLLKHRINLLQAIHAKCKARFLRPFNSCQKKSWAFSLCMKYNNEGYKLKLIWHDAFVEHPMVIHISLRTTPFAKL